MKIRMTARILLLLAGAWLASPNSTARAASIWAAVWSQQCKTSSPCFKVYFAPNLKAIDAEAAAKAENYLLIAIDSSTLIGIEQAVPIIEGTAPHVELVPAAGFSWRPTARYELFAKNLSLGGKALEDALQRRVQAELSGPEAKPPSASYSIVASDSRDESSVYFAGEITGASGQGPFYSVDAKVEVPRDYRLWNRLHRLSPFFNLRAGTSPKADPDSMNIGYAWRFNLVRFYDAADVKESALSKTGSPIPDLWWTNAGKLESDRDFDAANVFWESKLELPITALNRPGALVRFNPFAGAELGRSLQSPLREFEGRALARLLAGSTLLVKLGSPTRFSLEASYLRRWPLRDETTLVEDANKMLVIQSFGQAPREYVDVKLKVPLGDFFGAYGGYEYGELPPLYSLVDHRFRLGVVYQFAFDPPAPPR